MKVVKRGMSAAHLYYKVTSQGETDFSPPECKFRDSAYGFSFNAVTYRTLDRCAVPSGFEATTQLLFLE